MISVTVDEVLKLGAARAGSGGRASVPHTRFQKHMRGGFKLSVSPAIP